MSILMVTGFEGASNCAAVVGAQLGMEVEVAEGRKAAADGDGGDATAPPASMVSRT